MCVRKLPPHVSPHEPKTLVLYPIVVEDFVIEFKDIEQEAIEGQPDLMWADSYGDHSNLL